MHSTHQTFGPGNFHALCNQLAAQDEELANIIHQYGYPPFWSRAPTFHSLVHFILEQQVSLASARAAITKLEERLGAVTPANLLLLSDEALKSCYFSRQKISYARSLATMVLNGTLDIENLQHQPDAVVRAALLQVKGVGHWTADVFLMMALHRCDLFPTGDIALVHSTRQEKHLDKTATKMDIALLAEQWKPYRTIAAYLLWHAYLQRKLKR